MSDGRLDSGTSVLILFLTNLNTIHADSISELRSFWINIGVQLEGQNFAFNDHSCT